MQANMASKTDSETTYDTEYLSAHQIVFDSTR